MRADQVILNSLLGSLVVEGRIGKGSILDAGPALANDLSTVCVPMMYAGQDAGVMAQVHSMASGLASWLPVSEIAPYSH